MKEDLYYKAFQFKKKVYLTNVFEQKVYLINIIEKKNMC